MPDKTQLSIVTGLESGEIYAFKYIGTEWTKTFKVQSGWDHCSTVRRIRIRINKDGTFDIATCGNDHTVRILRLK